MIEQNSEAAQVMEREHAVTRDRRDFDGVEASNVQYMRHAATKSGRSPITLAREFLRLNRGRGRLPFSEYVQYGVYDTARHSPEEQSRFITNRLHWPITQLCCDMTFQAVTEEKWLCSNTLAKSGIRFPETLGVIDRGDRRYPGTRKISSADELRDFAKSRDSFPFFMKENRGMCSWGAMVGLEADDERIHIENEGWIDYEILLGRMIGDTAYILQHRETNHAFFGRYCGALATIRICLLLSRDGVRVPFAVLKLPCRGNIADSFWRPGNLACDVNPETGEVLTVRSKDALGTTDYSGHPETGQPILGERIPMWDRVLELAERTAWIFEPVRYQSMDIAVDENGPILVEVNTGGGFDLPQLASGRGFLTDQVVAFFRDCGYSKL